jgi:hypothetical protein
MAALHLDPELATDRGQVFRLRQFAELDRSAAFV